MDTTVLHVPFGVSVLAVILALGILDGLAALIVLDLVIYKHARARQGWYAILVVVVVVQIVIIHFICNRSGHLFYF